MGFIALAGGNEFRESCKLMDRRLLSLVTRQPAHVVILPTAAVQGSPRMAAENGVRHFKALGAEASSAMIITRTDANDPAKVEALADADILYIAGGDPGYLLDVLRGSALLQAIEDLYRRGGVIAGSSAGAMVLVAKMRAWNKGDWVPGLALVPTVGVLVHHEGPDSGAGPEDPADPATPILGIAEATMCFSSDGKAWEVAGSGEVTVYDEHSARRYGHGQQFHLE